MVESSPHGAKVCLARKALKVYQEIYNGPDTAFTKARAEWASWRVGELASWRVGKRNGNSATAQAMLSTGTVYYFRVSAVNHIGFAPSSGSSMWQMLCCWSINRTLVLGILVFSKGTLCGVLVKRTGVYFETSFPFGF